LAHKLATIINIHYSDVNVMRLEMLNPFSASVNIYIYMYMHNIHRACVRMRIIALTSITFR